MSDTPPDHQADTIDAQEESPSERPRRARVFKKGKMVFENGYRSVPCVVRNISDGGALLEFEQAFLMPKEFDLHIELEDYEVSCERRWEDGLKCGVQFVGEKRHRGQQRAQVLKSSEEALKSDLPEPIGYFNRKKDSDAEKDKASATPVRRARPAGSGKPTFGKRR